ncbi:9843_t:CDS:2 [Cetraspora pellucida]|uniref:9843_t:CDS:1 n=1 Tax=Cetraspora pellucida TaxID=1433469 RepID=A0ACA9KHC3_9GLOM|nr:9843_t:CDS:2 [Cetraspora pellucida]
MWPPSDRIPNLPDLPEVKSFIGVIFAVSGNILISIALNIQKNAHNELQKLELDRLDSSDFANNTSPQTPLGTRNFSTDDYEVPDPDEYGNTSYLHSKAWWAGLFLMVIGELGNFIAYAFAPASVIAPLGTVALISNVILAPIMLKERFRPQDLLGILIAIVGAVVVVINSKSDEVKEVIPTQFVLFTISAIIGSAILYNDFAEMDFWKCAGFLIGCFMTFVGVYFITSNRGKSKGYAKPGANSVPGTLRGDHFRSVLPDDMNAYNPSNEFDRYVSYPNSNATTIPRRHTLLEPISHASTPLLSGYDSNNNSLSRNDGLLLSLVHGSLTAGVSQALHSVGARHSHALGLDQVFENYWLKMIEQRSNESNNINGDSGFHRRSNSVPQPRTFNVGNYQNYQSNGRTNISSAASQDNDSENSSVQPKSLTNSSYLGTSYDNNSYYGSEYTDDDDSRTVSGRTTSTNGSNVGIYMGDSGSTYEAFPDLNYSEDMDDLPDLPIRRDYGNGITENESEI